MDVPTTVTTQVFPSPEHCQMQARDTMTLRGLIAELEGIYRATPENLREDIKVENYKALRGVLIRPMTTEERLTFKVNKLEEFIRNSVNSGHLTPEMVEGLVLP